MNEDKWPDNFTNPIESDRRGYRCIHCDVDGDSQFCHYHKKQIVSLPQHDKQMREEGAKAERERVLDDLGKILNSRIAKMEILNSKNPSKLREGILLAYRDIEDWERLQKESLRPGQEREPE